MLRFSGYILEAEVPPTQRKCDASALECPETHIMNSELSEVRREKRQYVIHSQTA